MDKRRLGDKCDRVAFGMNYLIHILYVPIYVRSVKCGHPEIFPYVLFNN
jgi:hypothetical protein